MKKAIVLSLAVLLTGIAIYAAASLTGNWEYSMTTPRGEQKFDMVFTQTGDKLDVVMKRVGRDGQITETKGTGTVKGADVEFSITRTGRDGNPMTTTYKGKIVDDDTITGKVTMMQNEIDWKATRKK
jgi:hypothetical protein